MPNRLPTQISSNQALLHLKGVILIILLLGVSFSGNAQFFLDDLDQDDGYYTDQFLRYENHIYDTAVHTVMLHPEGWPIAPPFIKLNDSDSRLELHFDILDSTLGNIMYTIIHCDHNWQKSELDIQEYMDGPPEDFLTDYDYSRNTFQRYVHYTLTIPNFNCQPTRSGNYLLVVYNSDERELILTRRFCVSEELVGIKMDVHQPSMVNQRYSHQEIDFEIYSPNYALTNPYEDLRVVILQNHTWQAQINDLKPRFVKENHLDYNHEGVNAMEGINEFRLIDIKNPRFTGRGVERVTYKDQENHAYLEMDKSRASKVYLENPDLNGWYHIQNDLWGGEGHVDADYVHTHFSLQRERPLVDGDVYVFGALTNWKIIPEAKMKFNQLELKYETTMYLKNGLYNYIYAFVADGQEAPDLSRFEGSHFQTENEYSILVYHRQLGARFDRLLGIQTINYPQR